MRDVLLCTQARSKGVTVHSRNEVTKLSTLINDGSHVIEMFKSSFEDYLKIYTKHKYNDIAIVIANDYRYDNDVTTIFVVCND